MLSRTALGVALAALLSAAAEAATRIGTAGNDPHLDWEREAAALLAGADDDARLDQWSDLVNRIGETAARTPAGIATQIRVVIFSASAGSLLCDADIRALENAVAALEQMAREG